MQHAYKKGDIVEIYNETLGGRPLFEGKATIKKLLDTDNYYLVEFFSEPGETYERFVNPPA